ncbi:hypothetical protein AX17_005723 [Amanita inopinata Kibby_2008]|nr:hypothetical protein AX17_005723 [Amanita inopinata Kibby_2008]
MQTTRVTRSSVLGKRAHQQQDASLNTSRSCEVQFPTPDNTPNPKRARTSLGYFDSDSNKENVPPLGLEGVGTDSSPSSAGATRALRRTATEITTPSRPRLVRRHTSTTILPMIPTSDVCNLGIATPPVTPKSLLPMHARARALLRSTCNSSDTKITCRDAERGIITDFLQSFMNDESTKKCMYISGSPGTGKTALLSSVIPLFASGSCIIIHINCMSLKNIDTLWERLLEELASHRSSNGKSTKLKGRSAVEAALASLTTKCVLVLDELDHIASDSRSLDIIFSLPDIQPNTLCLIGIANTHTLTSNTSSGASSTFESILTVHFAPYTAAQLQDILQSRLNALHDNGDDMTTFLPPPSLVLLTKKIAALTGDVRSLFEVMRGAIDIAVSTSFECDEPLNSSPKVTPAFILQALKAHSSPSNLRSKVVQTAQSTSAATGNSEIIAKIDCLNLQARVVLLCVLLASKRVEAGLSISSATSLSPKKAQPLKRSASTVCSHHASIDGARLHSYYSALLVRSDAACLSIVSKSEFCDLLAVLEGAGLISLSSASSPTAGPRQGRKMFRSASVSAGLCKNPVASEIRLVEGVWVHEVLRGLGIANAVDDDVLKSEIRSIWERETSRLEREVKHAKQSCHSGSVQD